MQVSGSVGQWVSGSMSQWVCLPPWGGGTLSKIRRRRAAAETETSHPPCWRLAVLASWCLPVRAQTHRRTYDRLRSRRSFLRRDSDPVDYNKLFVLCMGLPLPSGERVKSSVLADA
jgi:hypothetical protein